MQQDVALGKERVRAWPRKRGKPASPAQKAAQDKFRAVQTATKYVAPGIYQFAYEATQNSPLLTRDALTMMLYNRYFAITLDDGRTLYPMPAIQDVSESLDVLGRTPGTTLKRGPQLWQAVPAGNGAGLGYLTLIDQTITSPIAHIDALDLGDFQEFIALCLGVTASASTSRSLVLSTDNGTSFYDTAGDYIRISNTGVGVASGAINFHQVTSSAQRWGILHVIKGVGGTPTIALSGNGEEPRVLTATALNVDAIRFRVNPSHNITGGRYVLMAR